LCKAGTNGSFLYPQKKSTRKCKEVLPNSMLLGHHYFSFFYLLKINVLCPRFFGGDKIEGGRELKIMPKMPPPCVIICYCLYFNGIEIVYSHIVIPAPKLHHSNE
jgi:hypothetical protein